MQGDVIPNFHVNFFDIDVVEAEVNQITIITDLGISARERGDDLH